MSRPLIHIGYHKTASSWLQTHLFPQHDLGLEMLPRQRVVPIVDANPLHFNAPRVGASLQEWCETTDQRGLRPVISHERLSGYPGSGGFDSKDIAARLYSLFPDARILIMVREQVSAITSNYHQYVIDGGALSLSRFLDPPTGGVYRAPMPSLQFFEYDALASEYARLYGNHNVLVLPYELLARDPNALVQRILQFAGSNCAVRRLPYEKRVYAGTPAIAIASLRLSNLLFRANPLHPTPMLPSARAALWFSLPRHKAISRVIPARLNRFVKDRWQQKVVQTVGKRFAASNARLSKMCPVDLSTFGYSL